MTEINFLVELKFFCTASSQCQLWSGWVKKFLPPSKADAMKCELNCETTLISTSETTLHDPVQFHLDFFQELNEQ
jgi:hypothetical protein